MERVLYIDCFSGISGDMMVGALLDLGVVGIEDLRDELRKLDISGYHIVCREVMAGSIKAKKFDVEIDLPQPERDYRDIAEIIGGSKLNKATRETSLNIFRLIAEAESIVHGCKIDDVKFHEVGAVDSIIDIVGTAICLDRLKIKSFYSRVVPVGSGFVECSHGRLPVPAPATIEILKNVPVCSGNFNFEVTTPTGAAIIKTLVKNFGGIPCMEIEETGYGAGDSISDNKSSGIPDVLRLVRGVTKDEYKFNEDRLIMLSANVDDSTPEIIGNLMEELFRQDIADAWVESIYMKKNRPAFKICVLCREELEKKIANMIMLETTTLGIRREKIKRYLADRELKIVKLPYGEVKVKTGILEGKVINISPEFESCKKLAEKTGKTLKEIYQDALLFFSKK